jgi:AraC-like DNA-binding protein
VSCQRPTIVQRVAKALSWIREHFAQPMAIEDLADLAHMSVSSFHQHFKAVTSMSPLQYQEVLRLHEARRMMLSRMLDAGGAGGGTGFVSPSIVKVGGEDHVVMVAAARGLGRNATGGSVNGIDPLTGKVLWTYLNFQCSIPVAHAVDAGEGRVLMTGGYRAGSAMIKIQKKADGTYDVAELFTNPDFGSHTQPPILYKDHFYVQYTINERSDGLVCMTMDGQVKWRTGDEPPFNKGGAVLADGLLLATDGNTKLYLIDPDPAAFKPLASAELLEPANDWAPIALVDGRLLIRDQKQMKCLQVAQQIKEGELRQPGIELASNPLERLSPAREH